MIKNFSVLYVGFTELDNVGLDGTPADERRYSSEHIAKAYTMSLEVAQHMDELGFYALWGAEHHFQCEGYEVIPNLILWGTYLAARTQRLKLGCAFNVTPIWHPIRLAEDYALADNLTGAGSYSALAAAIRPARWKRSAHRCWTARRTRSCTRSRWR